MKRLSNTTPYKDESRLFYFACSLLVIVASLYMYFVSESVMHVVMRKEIDSEISDLATTIGQLDTAYIEMQHSVSSDIASLKGFKIAKEKVFIDKASDTLVVLKN
jgi:hypothetical protein